MKTMTGRPTALVVLAALLMATLIPAARVIALTNSSLALSDPRTNQTNVSYTLSVNGLAGSSIQCIDIFLNTAADGSGSAVPGIDTSSFDLSSSTALTVGSWTENTSVNGRLRITSAGETPSANGNFVFTGINNGSNTGTTYYAVFTSYSTSGCTGGSEVDEVSVAFVYTDGELVELTVEPTLTFSVNSVGSGEDVNSVQTTAASSASGIDFGNNVTQAANGISAHDLVVTTNAVGGYTVYIRHTGNLSNGSHDIDNHSGTNASPTSFPGVGTEAWGYATEDSSLAGGTANRFTTGNNWAGFSETNQPVMDNTSATVGTDTTRVGHQVGIAATTPAGSYQTTIVYTVTSTY